MDAKPRTMPADATLAAFRLAHPLGSAHYVALVDAEGHYAGLVTTPEAHASGDESDSVSTLARLTDASLRPEQNIREAMDAFQANESEMLAVADANGLLVGTLSETYAARRYAAAVDVAIRGVLGGA
jgi:CIC family chloride channel protein